MKPLERKTVNHKLSMAGLASLAEPRALLSQVAMGIKTHDQFRQLLAKVSPEDRPNCYNSLANRLCFVPKPLDNYIAEARNQADAERLPTFDAETGKISEYGAVGPLNINAMAEKAIIQREKEERAKGSLELVCTNCTFSELFPGINQEQSYQDAGIKGWTFELDSNVDGPQEIARCPKCSKRRTQ